MEKVFERSLKPSHYKTTGHTRGTFGRGTYTFTVAE